MSDSQTDEDWLEGAEIGGEGYGIELFSGSWQIDPSMLPEPPADESENVA